MRKGALPAVLLVATGCFALDAADAPAEPPDTPPAVCGDGRFDPALEACDGSAEGSPACRQDCTLDRCGDGTLDPGEACEPLLAPPGLCLSDCSWPRCGDAVLDPGEACDEGSGNGAASPSCTQNCTAPVCGDGLVSPRLGEQCDGGPGCVACARTSCGVVHVAAATWGFLLVRDDGALFVTGAPAAHGLPVEAGPSPRRVEGAPAFVRLSVRDHAGAGLTSDGRLFTFGPPTYGQRGDGTIGALPAGAAAFFEPLPARRFRDVVTTRRAVVALEADGTLWSFGGDRTAELGPFAPEDEAVDCAIEGGRERCRPTPAPLVLAGLRPVGLAGGDEVVVVLDADGTAWGFGANAWRQLGRAQADDCPGEGPGEGCVRVPVRLGAARGAAANAKGIVLIDRPGAAFGLGGWETFGVAGDGAAGHQELVPLAAPADRAIEEVAGAGASFVARTRDGGWLGWGFNGFRRIDPDAEWDRLDPHALAAPGGGPLVELAAGEKGSVVLLADGRAFGLGSFEAERLGPLDPQLTPDELDGGATSPVELHVCP